jgi:hypothetical protein
MRVACLVCWAWLRSSLAVSFRSRFAGSGFASPRCSRAPAGARSSARVPAGACCWLQLTVSFGARRHSAGPCEVRLLAVVCGLRVLIAVPEQLFPRPAAPPSLLCGARTLSQQEKNNSADVQRGRVNRPIIICASSNETIAAMYLRRVRVVGRAPRRARHHMFQPAVVTPPASPAIKTVDACLGRYMSRCGPPAALPWADVWRRALRNTKLRPGPSTALPGADV